MEKKEKEKVESLKTQLEVLQQTNSQLKTNFACVSTAYKMLNAYSFGKYYLFFNTEMLFLED